MGFDWHKYVKIEGVDADYLARISPDKAAYLRRAEQLIDKTMDQISAIPEVQKIILDNAENGSIRLLNAGNTDRLADPRLIIALSPGLTDYQPAEHKINLGEDRLPYMQFGNPPYPFTLQGILIHEMQHGGDPKLNNLEANELQVRKQAYLSTVTETLERFPAAAEEFKTSKTILGKDPMVPMEAQNLEDMKNKVDDVFQRTITRTSLEEFNRAISPESLLNDPAMAIKTFMNSAYQEKAKLLIQSTYEDPVVERTNTIMAKYYGEPPRKDYNGSLQTDQQQGMGKDERPNYKHGLEALNSFVHPEILPKAGIAPEDRVKIDGVEIRIPETNAPENKIRPDAPTPAAPAAGIRLQ